MPIPVATRFLSYTGHQGRVFALAKADDGDRFYTSGEDGQVVQWSAQQETPGLGIAKVKGSIYSMLYLPGTDQLAVAENYNGLHLIDLETRTRAASSALTKGQLFAVYAWQDFIFCATSDGELLVVAQHDLKLYRRIKLSGSSLRSISVNETTEEIAIGSSDSRIYIVDLVTFATKQSLHVHTRSVFTAVYSPDDLCLVSGSLDAHIASCNAASPDYALLTSIIAHQYTVNALAFTPDGRYFASASKDKAIRLWDSQTYQLCKVIDKRRHAGHLGSVNNIVWMDNKTLAAVSDDRSVSVWKIQW